MSQIHVVAKVEAQPGKAEPMRDVLAACVGPTRQEAGCRSYTLHQDLQTPELFFFYETWDSQAALDSHMRTPHFRQLAGDVKPLLAAPLQINVVRALG